MNSQSWLSSALQNVCQDQWVPAKPTSAGWVVISMQGIPWCIFTTQIIVYAKEWFHLAAVDPCVQIKSHDFFRQNKQTNNGLSQMAWSSVDSQQICARICTCKVELLLFVWLLSSWTMLTASWAFHRSHHNSSGIAMASAAMTTEFEEDQGSTLHTWFDSLYSWGIPN